MLKNLKQHTKRLSITALAGLTALSLVGCNDTKNAADGSATEEKVKISLYSTGSLNVQNFWEEVIPMFEEKNNDIDVELVFLAAGQGGQSTMDRMLAAKKADKDSGVDIYEGGLEDALRGEQESLFEKLDEKNIPNIQNIEEKNMNGTNGLAIPHRASAVVLAYNSDNVKEVPNTPEELYTWIKKHPGKFAYNDPTTGGSGSSFVISTLYNQLPADAMNIQDESIMKDWDKGFEILNNLESYLYKEGVYPKKNQGTLDLLANGEVDMVPAWSDMALEQMNNKLLPETTKLKQLEPGFTGGPAYLMVPADNDEKEKEAAQELVNFVLTPEVQKVVIEQMYGFPGIKWDLLDQELQKKFESVSEEYRIFNGGLLGEEINKRWQKEIAN